MNEFDIRGLSMALDLTFDNGFELTDLKNMCSDVFLASTYIYLQNSKLG